MTAFARLPLTARVCLINVVCFVGGTAVLAFSPATVSANVLASEGLVLLVGLSAILVGNWLLIRAALAPMDRLVRVVDRTDVLRQGERLPEDGTGVAAPLVHGFNALLGRLERERATTRARLVAAQEAERHRVARELHDEIGQGLTVVLLALGRVVERADEPLTGDLRAVRESVRTSLDGVREVARRLRPGVLDDLGLANALAALSTDFSVHGGMTVTRRFTPGLPTLSREVELVVYRVAQEALTNAARHSGGQALEVSLGRTGGGVTLAVADDGRGRPDRWVEGAGITGMRERALLVGGTLDLEPGQTCGTRVVLRVPVADVDQTPVPA